VASERVSLAVLGNDWFDRSPEGIYHFGFERAHDVRDLHLVVGFGLHPTSQPGRHDDRWMVFVIAYPRDL
jgi:hypothetical protein